ncbi:putative P-loop containing nucleoside triphosphate hydrolase, ABC transporter family G [Helianthus anomalus]
MVLRVTSKKDQEQFWMRRDEPYRFVVPGLRTGSQLGTKLGLVVKFGPCNMLAELSRRERDANIKPDPDTDVFMKVAATKGQEASLLGLDICVDTMIGDQIIRGISAGQKKRVTTGEMIVGPSKVLLMDEISTGLDSSTTYQVVNSLKKFLHILEGTAVISLFQRAPETYDLFDDIILLTDGKIVYQGPRENVPEFFESMGFKCPERKGVADFLQEVSFLFSCYLC